MRKSWALLAASTAVIGVAHVASADLLVNGDFSANVSSYTNGAGYNNSPGNPSDPTGWSNNAPGNTGVAGVGGTAGIYFGPQSDASNTTVDFGFVQDSGNYYYQTFSVTPGTLYTVGYSLGERLNDGGINQTLGYFNGGATSTVFVVDGADPTGTLVLGTSGPVFETPQYTQNFYTEPDVTFLATSNTATLVLENTSQPGDYTSDYAEVSVNPVPEPASLGLLSVAGIGLLARRRRIA